MPVGILYIIPMARYRPDVITPEARAIPQRVWAIMGAFDSLAGVMQSLAISNLQAEGGLVVLLLQSAIPMSMIITKIFLKVKYRPYQYTGACVVGLGIIIALIPQLIGGNTDSASKIAIWSSVLVLSCVPMCLSSVYKEKSLGDTEIDPIFLNVWVCVYQFALSFPLLIPMAYANGLTISQIPSNLLDGIKCYVNISPNAANPCTQSALFLNLYMIFNIMFNILIIALLKFGSSNMLWLCLTIQVPVANLVFGIPSMPGYAPVTWEAGVGLVVIMAGLIAYRFWPLLKPRLWALMGWPLLPEAPSEGTTVSAEDDPSNAGTTKVVPDEFASPGGVSGSTPVRGMHTHLAPGKKGGAGGRSAAARAEAIAQARSTLDKGTSSLN